MHANARAIAAVAAFRTLAIASVLWNVLKQLQSDIWQQPPTFGNGSARPGSPEPGGFRPILILSRLELNGPSKLKHNSPPALTLVEKEL